ncbi:MAG: hypothetical protein KGI08_03630 [Thaumarchaeota archaeon]|nr:hypothetical protein [Nitrososphaerota archaeon]
MKKKLWYLYGQFSVLSPKITIGIFDSFSKMCEMQDYYQDKIPHVYYDEVILNKTTGDIQLALGQNG